jgi:acetyl coenzyme A synthetase (ADP forming)-like protein
VSLPRDHVLGDGTTVHLREVRPDDAERVLAMWGRTSVESRRARFMGTFTLSATNVGRFVDLTAPQQFAVVATRGRGETERIVGIARYERDEDRPRRAEFAALVEDAEQGRGIGTALVREVALRSAEVGITHLAGDILSSNTRMLNLVRQLGLEYASRDDAGVVRSDLETNLTERFLAVVDEEERQAATASLTRFLKPRSIAVVGASRNRLAIGGLVFDNALRGGFQGAVYPVNPNASAVQGVATYATLSDCPTVPDLVMVCVPAPMVNDVVEEAGRLGVKATCVISAGFAEVEGGAALQEELLARARGFGMRLVGPNCMGLMNGRPEVRMNTTFSTTFPRPGRVSMSSQSGALGLAVLEHVERLGLGISTFVSVGNKADTSGNDLLLYWEEDEDTDVILMYLESFGNPRRFSRIARRISRTKPIVAVKSGRTSAGERAASSHTAAISAGDTAVQALFGQAGVIRTDTLEELFDVATMLSSQGLPRGRNVAVLTNAGGPGILAADALESNGLEVPALSDRTRAQLAEFLPAEAGTSNPVDMIASASPEAYRRAMTILGAADEIDAVFVIFIPTGTTASDDVARAIVAAKAELSPDVPVVSVFMSAMGMPPALADANIPSFAFPEAAARALGRVAAYARWRRRPLGQVIEPEAIDRDAARAVVDKVLEGAVTPSPAERKAGRDAGRWCSTEEASAILAAYGVPMARSGFVATAEEGAALQREWSVPVAVKVAAAIHKADVGGIELDLRSGSAVAEAIGRIEANLERHGLGEHVGRYLVQEMIDGGVEMVVGVTHDPSFGPIIVTGMGGTLVELLRDVAVRITPVTDEDVAEMLDELRMAPLLRGYRGSAPADVDALKDLIHRINAMVEDLPEVAELDLNPVFVRPDGQGVVAVDVRLRLAPAARPSR